MKSVFEKHELEFRKKPEALTNFWLRLITATEVENLEMLDLQFVAVLRG
jgi:hypothetical protein